MAAAGAVGVVHGFGCRLVVSAVERPIEVWFACKTFNLMRTTSTPSRKLWLRMITTEEVALGVGLKRNFGLVATTNAKRVEHDSWCRLVISAVERPTAIGFERYFDRVITVFAVGAVHFALWTRSLVSRAFASSTTALTPCWS